jgi:hypothetical protein
MKKSLLVLLFSALGFGFHLQAQSEEKFGIHVGTDIASAYIWRGMESSQALNIQPTLEFTFGGFFGGFWGSYAINGSFQEPDIYAGFASDYFSFSITDFHLNSGIDYFDFNPESTLHAADAVITINGPEKFPLQLTLSSIVFGADKKVESVDSLGNNIYSDKNNYSSYVELAYPFSTSAVDVVLSLGLVPFESDFYGTTKVSFINASLSASKEIFVSENFSLPINFTITANPNNQQVFFILMLSL